MTKKIYVGLVDSLGYVYRFFCKCKNETEELKWLQKTFRIKIKYIELFIVTSSISCSFCTHLYWIFFYENERGRKEKKSKEYH